MEDENASQSWTDSTSQNLNETSTISTHSDFTSDSNSNDEQNSSSRQKLNKVESGDLNIQNKNVENWKDFKGQTSYHDQKAVKSQHTNKDLDIIQQDVKTEVEKEPSNAETDVETALFDGKRKMIGRSRDKRNEVAIGTKSEVVTDQNDAKSGQSVSNVTFHDATTLPTGNHFEASDDMVKKKNEIGSSEVDPSSEFDDETRSSKTKHKNTASLLVNDEDTSHNDIPQTNDQVTTPPQLDDYFATQCPVVEVDMFDLSITSGLTSGLGTEGGETFHGSSPASVNSTSHMVAQNIGMSENFIPNSKIPIPIKKEKQSHVPQLKNIPEEEKNARHPHLNNTPQSSWPTQLPDINQSKKTPDLGRDRWASPRLYDLYLKKESLNHICAECSLPLLHADSIYACFYIDPTEVKKKIKNRKKTTHEKREAYQRRKSSIDEIIVDLIDPDESGSDVEELDDDLHDKEVLTFGRQYMFQMDRLSSLTGFEKDEKTPSFRSVRLSKDSSQSSNLSSLSVRSPLFFLNEKDMDIENETTTLNNSRRKMALQRKRKKLGPLNHRLYHIAKFENLHSYHGVSGFSSRFVSKPKERKKNSPQKFSPRKAFIQRHGVFTCKDCAFAHNTLGRTITTVKSVYVTTHWSDDELEMMESRGGNLYSKEVFEKYIPQRFKNRFSLHSTSTMEERIMFTSAKYELFAFIVPNGPLAKISRWDALLKPDVLTKRVQKSVPSMRLPDRLIDYFCVVGATKSVKKTITPLNCEKLPTGSFSTNSFNIELQPKVWDCYPLPKNAHSDMMLPKFLPNFAFPNGCRPSSKKKSPQFFTFVLTLEHTNAQVYASALIIYEDIVYLDQILDCLQNEGYLNTKFVENDISGSIKSIPKKTKEARQKLFLPKALIVLSHYPFYNLHRTFLQQIHLISHAKSTPLPIERYISNFCTDIPLPPRGQIKIKFGYFDDKEGLNTWFSRPAKNVLPLVGCSFRPLFTSLSVSNILVIFACLSQEMRIVLCSKQIAMLTPVAEALKSVLFPFVWQGLYIPVLPFSMLDFLQSPEPFLVGVHSRYLTDVCKKSRPNGVVFVDLDKDIVHLGFEDGETASIERRTLKLPDKEVEKLKSKLDKYGGLAYLPPSGGQQGRLTSGLGLETVVNSDREKYANQNSMAGLEKRKGASFMGESFGQLRGGILAKVDEAYVNDEHLRTVYFPETTLGTGAKFMKSNTDIKIRKKGKQVEKKEKDKRSLLDPNLDEKGGFSTSEIRQEFLRFFAVILRHYSRFLIIQEDHVDNAVKNLDRLFDVPNFLKKAAYSNDNTFDFLSKFTKTRMFREFIRERVENPKLPEMLLFDETIIVRKNLSKKNKLKGGLKKTPFLSDKSDWDLEPFISPPPSTFNLPFMSRRFYKTKFPRLHHDLYGLPRSIKKWHTESFQRKTSYCYPFYNDALSKIYISSPFSNTPEWDLQWAMMAIAFREPICTDWRNNHVEKQNLSHIEKQNRLLQASILTGNKISLAKQYTNLGRIDSMKKLWGITKMQGLHRMHVLRNRYRNILSMIIFLQSHIRDSLFRKKYGSTFRGVNEKVKDIQRVFRGSRGRATALKRRHCAQVIQQTMKSVLVRLRFIKLRRAATFVASYYRVRHVRSGFLLVRQLVALIQAHVRGWLRRQTISEIRRDRILKYRGQLFELWRRSATPLSYRSKFWKLLNKNCFLHLALHEEELARVWEVLGIKVSLSTTVYEKCEEIQVMLDSKKNKTVPIFPAEMTPQKDNESDKQKNFLKLAKIRLLAERQKIYSILKNMEIDTRQRVFKLFNLDDKEEKKKERIVKCLWEYRSLIKPSIIFVLNLYNEFGNLENVINNRGFVDILKCKPPTNIPPASILRRFGLDLNSQKTHAIVKRCTKNMSVWVQIKLDERVQKDLLGAAQASFDAIHGSHDKANRKTPASLSRKRKIPRHSDCRSRRLSGGNSLYIKNADEFVKRKRLELARSYLNQTRHWTKYSRKRKKKIRNKIYHV